MNKHYFRSLQKLFLPLAKAFFACCKSQSCRLQEPVLQDPPQNTFLATFLLRVGKISQ